MTRFKAFMLGPQGENSRLYKELLSEIIDDHVFWRRNFHPEDYTTISAMDQASGEFQGHWDKLRVLVYNFLAESKKGIQFFSPRYIGHMNSDLLIPATLGYFASMLYNQNNVASESSPVTVAHEKEALELIQTMLGFEKGRAWGYLTGGGTAANYYSVWVARTMYYYPLALRLFLEAKGGQESASIARQALIEGLSVDWCAQTICFRELDAWQLLNLRAGDILNLKSCAEIAIMRSLSPVQLSSLAPGQGKDREKASMALHKFVDSFSGGFLGLCELLNKGRSSGIAKKEIFEKIPKLLWGANKHYCWPKAAEIFGLGKMAGEEVPIKRDFTMSAEILREKLEAFRSNEQPVLMVVANLGTTEEGAMDPLAEIVDLQKEYGDKGLSFWLHADACYGGYFASLLRPASGSDRGNPVTVSEAEKLKMWFEEIAKEALSKPALENGEELLTAIKESKCCLKWDEWTRRISSLANCDSVAVDPHKLGYVPYPAGAVVLGDKRAREFIQVDDAPYLQGFVGMHTLEGSRPGASASACWLAHKSVPLNRESHGKLLAMSMAAARLLDHELDRVFNKKDSNVVYIRFNQIHLNMLIYVVCPRRGIRDVKRLNTYTESLAGKVLRPVRDIRDFMAVTTEIRSDGIDKLLKEFNECHPGLEISLENNSNGAVKVIRSVVMSPFGVMAATRSSDTGTARHIYSVFAEKLLESSSQMYSEFLRDEALEMFRNLPHQTRILFLDDQAPFLERMKESLPRLLSDRIAVFMSPQTTLRGALDEINSGAPLPFVFLDIDLGVDGPDGGFHAYKAICLRNRRLQDPNSRVRVVVFLTWGNTDYENRVQEIDNSVFGKASRPHRVHYIGKPELEGHAPDSVLRLREALLNL